jgi:uncharacterized membrane protein
MLYCQKCGAQVSPDVRFCPTCGQPMTPGAPVGPAPAVAAWTPPVGVKAQTGRWISQGWEMVKLDIGNYMLMALILFAVNSVGSIITQGPLTAGFHIVCMKRMMNRKTEIGDLFKGFNYFVPALVAALIISLFVFGGTLLCIVPGLVLGAMYNFTYLFIVDKRLDFWPAMQASHAVVKNDYFGFSMFLLVLGLINLLGILCCIVGIFITMPITIAATTVAYKELVGFDPGTVETL